jgi:hypothetical protein
LSLAGDPQQLALLLAAPQRFSTARLYAMLDKVAPDQKISFNPS